MPKLRSSFCGLRPGAPIRTQQTTLAWWERRTTEVAVAVHALNRMLDLGRPSYVRVA